MRGDHYFIVFPDDGTLKSVGRNHRGQANVKDNVIKKVYTDVNYITGAKSVHFNDTNTFVLMKNGTVRSWGYNECGIHGTGNITTVSTVRDPGLTNIKDISVGNKHILYLTNDNEVIYGGGNWRHQSGDPSKDHSSFHNYFKLSNISDLGVIVQAVAGNDVTFLLNEDGDVFVAGFNNVGQAGAGNVIEIEEFMKINISNVRYIERTEYAAFFITYDDDLYVTGRNRFGELGLGDEVSRIRPVKNTFFKNNVKNVVAGDNHTIVLTNDGNVYTFGDNNFGQCGKKGKTYYNEPILIKQEVKEIGCTSNTTILLTESNRVESTGYNTYYTIGNGNKVNQYVPVLSFTTEENIHLADYSGYTIKKILTNSVLINDTIYKLTDNQLLQLKNAFKDALKIEIPNNSNIIFGLNNELIKEE